MTLLGAAFALGLIVGGAVARDGGPQRQRRLDLARPQRSARADAGYGMRSARPRSAPRPRCAASRLDQRGLVPRGGRHGLDPPAHSASRLIRCSSQFVPRIDSLFQAIRPAVETRRDQTRTEIRALLTPPEQQRYDSMNRADDEQRKKMRDQGGRPGAVAPCSGSPGGPGPRGGFDRGPH